MPAALEGLRILDLTHGLPGPYCTKLFADNGAEVIKIERPGTGDIARRLGPFPGDEPHPEKSGPFLALNTGKQSVTLDLKTGTGHKIVERLAQDVDMVVASFRPGVLEQLGLSYARLREINPRALLLTISNFGQSGPYRDYKIDDMLLYAMGNNLFVTGQPDREPNKIGLYAPVFLAAGVAAAMGMGAYWGARRDGEGQWVDIPLMEVMASTLDRAVNNILSVGYTGDLTFRRSRDFRMSIMPSGVYPCADGYVHLVSQPYWWHRFCRTFDRLDLIEDKHFTDNMFDMEMMVPELDAIMYPWLLSHTKQEIMEKGQAQGLPVSAVNTMADVFRDPQFRFRNFFTQLDPPHTGPLEFPGPPFRLTDSPGEIRRAPTLGQHNVPVLCDHLGYSKPDLVILRERGII